MKFLQLLLNLNIITFDLNKKIKVKRVIVYAGI